MLEDLVTNYGYVGVFVGGIANAELAAVLGGLAAQARLLRLPLVIVAAAGAGLCGDGIGFLMGRLVGARLLARYPSWAEKVRTAQDLLVRRHTPVVLGLRFLLGIRAAMAFAIGSSPIPAYRFFLLDAVGAAAWATVTVVSGYLAGRALNVVVGDVKLVVLVIGATAVLLMLLRILAGRLWARMRKDA